MPELITVHVEIPSSGLPLIEVPRDLLPDVEDEADLVLRYADIPILPYRILVLSDSGEGMAVHVEIPAGEGVVLIELPENPSDLDLQDEENLQVWDIAGPLLALLKHNPMG